MGRRALAWLDERMGRAAKCPRSFAYGESEIMALWVLMARILLMLALTKTTDTKEIQRMFYTY